MGTRMSHRLNRDESLQRLRETSMPWDVLVIGGGATGVAIAMDAASRGMHVLLVEQSDFGKGTSSRSTKLVHGGVRYLRQGNFTLVRDALRERSLLKKNAPDLVIDLQFLIPCESWWQRFFYGVGLKVYDLLAGSSGFGRSRGASQERAIEWVPTLSQNIRRGGVLYHDGQFDDARLLISMARTAADNGACLLNYAAVTELLKNNNGKLTSAVVHDRESNTNYTVSARCIVNAAGPFCDAVRKLDDAAIENMLSVSQGVHIVLPRRFLPKATAVMVPKTSDGRVIFLIPWHEHVVVGTTDTPIVAATLEPKATPEEITFLLETATRYLSVAPTRADILSVFTGIRPLVKGDPSARTASLSRDHTIRVAESGLVTITGGKWTTVRKMAEDCVDRVLKESGLTAGACKTKSLPLYRNATGTQETPSLHPSINLCEQDVVDAVRNEMARTVEDVLARRSRILFLDARAAIDLAPRVASLMAKELMHDASWCDTQVNEFSNIAQHYLPQEV